MLIVDDLVPHVDGALLHEKDYLYPESLKESNPAYALYLEHIGARFYKENGVTVSTDKNGKDYKCYHVSIKGRI